MVLLFSRKLVDIRFNATYSEIVFTSKPLANLQFARHLQPVINLSAEIFGAPIIKELCKCKEHF